MLYVMWHGLMGIMPFPAKTSKILMVIVWIKVSVKWHNSPVHDRKRWRKHQSDSGPVLAQYCTNYPPDAVLPWQRMLVDRGWPPRVTIASVLTFVTRLFINPLNPCLLWPWMPSSGAVIARSTSRLIIYNTVLDKLIVLSSHYDTHHTSSSMVLWGIIKPDSQIP